jgi:hypothetical protein
VKSIRLTPAARRRWSWLNIDKWRKDRAPFDTTVVDARRVATGPISFNADDR